MSTAEDGGPLAPTETAFTLLVTSVLDYGMLMLDP